MLEPQIVRAIFIAPLAGAPMQEVQEVEAIAGCGLKGDRYSRGEGRFNRDRLGKRQVTLMNAMFFPGSRFEFHEARRNIFTENVELMDLMGKEFQVGAAKLRGGKYCDPCERPNKLCGKKSSFKEAFFDRGGLVCEIVDGGLIRVGDSVITPKKDY